MFIKQLNECWCYLIREFMKSMLDIDKNGFPSTMQIHSSHREYVTTNDITHKHFIQTADIAVTGDGQGGPPPFLVTFDETLDWKTCSKVQRVLEQSLGEP